MRQLWPHTLQSLRHFVACYLCRALSLARVIEPPPESCSFPFGGRHDQDHHSRDSCVALFTLKSKNVPGCGAFSGIGPGTHVGQTHARRMGFLEALAPDLAYFLPCRAWSRSEPQRLKPEGLSNFTRRSKDLSCLRLSGLPALGSTETSRYTNSPLVEWPETETQELP